MKKNMIKGLVLATLLTLPTISMATDFWKSGTINRVLVHTGAYGKCMLNISVILGNGCPSSWISLDCEGKYTDKGDGDRLLQVALIAQTMNKKISVQVDNSKKHNGYCIARRIDIMK